MKFFKIFLSSILMLVIVCFCGFYCDIKATQPSSAKQVLVFCPDAKIEYVTTFLPRSQGLDSAALFNPYFYDCCGFVDYCYNFFAGFRYSQSMKNQNIKGSLFGPVRGQPVVFSGVKAAEKNSFDLRADDFGLAPNFLGKLYVSPQISNYILDFSLQFNLEKFSERFERAYFRINSCLVNSVWDLNVEENKLQSKTKEFSNFPPTYMSVSAAKSAPNIETALSGDFLFGDMKTKWKYGKFKFKHNSSFGISNIDLILGYDFLRRDYCHFGGFFKTGIPTGTKPDARYFFQPIIGNGHHWELGFGIDAHYNLLNCNETCLQLYINGCISHLLPDVQYRSFDFNSSFSERGSFFQSGRLSRYLLLKEFDQAGNYKHNLVNAINLNTAKIKSTFDLQADFSTQLIFRKCGLNLGIGYNVYFRSAEDLKLKSSFSFYDKSSKKYGIKGGTGVASRLWEAWPLNPNFGKFTGKLYTLNSTESKVRLLNLKGVLDARYIDNQMYLLPPVTEEREVKCSNPPFPDYSTYQVGMRWDDLSQPPLDYIANADMIDSDSIIFVDKNGNQIPVPTISNGMIDYCKISDLIAQGATFKPAPVLLTDNDVDLCSGRIPSQITHKFFAYLTYAWEDCCCWQPFIGIGGEIETAPRCKTATLNQWCLWLHFGISF